MGRTQVPLTQALHPVTVTDPLNDPSLQVLAQGPELTQRYFAPRSMHIERVIREPLLATRLIDGEDQFEWAFDRFEFAVGLLQTTARAARTIDQPLPLLPALAGVFSWRRGGRGHDGPYDDLGAWVDDPVTHRALLPDGDPDELLRQAHLGELAMQTRNNG